MRQNWSLFQWKWRGVYLGSHHIPLPSKGKNKENKECLLSDNLSVFVVISQIFFTIILQWFYCFWLVFTLSQCWFSGKEPSLLWSLKVHLNLNQRPVMILGRFSSVLRHSCSAEGLCSLFQGQQDNMSQYQRAGQVHLCTDSLQQDVF